jgi:protein-S-isoprenylcysteine O-methyltransferase Ste14
MTNRKINVTAKNLPRSCTSGLISFVGLVSLTIAFYLISEYKIDNYVGAILTGLAYVIPVFILEFIMFKTFKKSSTGLDFNLKNDFNVERVIIKLIGLYFTLALIAVFYWLFPVYSSDYYLTYWTLAKSLLKIIVIGSIPYFFILDRFLVEPEESYWKVGMIVLGRWNKINTEGLKNHFLGWLVKAFFLPLMFVSLCGNIGYMKEHPFLMVFNRGNFAPFFDYMYNFVFTVDLAVIFVGYILTLRIFDSHIRSVEPSFLGWFVALQCYQPFWGFVSSNYLSYDSGYSWGQWLWEYQNLYVLWGSVILILLSIYSLSSLYFGLRFSNLTNRGILTNGPYRYMRHPAYVSKNISWWLMSIPFISQQGFLIGLKHCFLLLFVNIIYYLRAKTEEKHLSQDPNYVQYATVMNEIGIFRGLFKVLPFLKYSPRKLVNRS